MTQPNDQRESPLATMAEGGVEIGAEVASEGCFGCLGEALGGLSLMVVITLAVQALLP